MDEISNLARSLSEHSTQDEKGNTVNPFFSKDSLLDPKSKDFSPRAWLEALVGVTSRDPDRYPNKTAGVAFRDLSAHGFGKVTDYQKTFGNYAFELLSLGKKIIGRQQVTRIQILRDFDGLVKKGQMLLVLGRPGRLESPLKINGFY
jgi:ATP-binding cassette subfamily G (WHITE) protein 2 (PDR)